MSAEKQPDLTWSALRASFHRLVRRWSFWNYRRWLIDSEKAVVELNRRIDHYKSLADRHHRDSDRYRAWLYEAWKTNKGQTKGLQRQARKIKRLKAQLSETNVEAQGGAKPLP